MVSASHDPAPVLFTGRCKRTAYLGSYLKATLFLAMTVGAAIGLSRLPELSAYPVWLIGVLGIPPLIVVVLKYRTTRYTITTRRIEFERGILTRRVDSLELWRVLDVSYSQSLSDRLFGDARITLVGTDRSDPALVLYGLPDHRRLFEALRDAVQRARHAHRPIEFAGPDDAPMTDPR